MGAIGRSDRARLFERHLQECLNPRLTEYPTAGSRVLDVGSGAGLPGIPLALVRPDLEVTLLEPRHRRAAFLQRVVLTLRLDNASVVESTLEELSRVGGRRWQLACSRALRWTGGMVRALAEVLEGPGELLRFGSGAVVGTEGVRLLPLAPGSTRALQVWTRESWAHLPDAP